MSIHVHPETMEHVLLSLSLKRALVYGNVKRIYWLTVWLTSKPFEEKTTIQHPPSILIPSFINP